MERKIKKGLFLLIPVPLAYFFLYWKLSSSGGWLMMGIFTAIPLLSLLSQFMKIGKRAINTLQLTMLTLLSILLIGEVLFLPYQAYQLWFELLEQGLEQGRVSHLFVKFGAFFTAIVCWIIARQDTGFVSVRKTLYLALFFLFILRPNLLSAFAFLVALLWSRIEKKNVVGMIIMLAAAFSIGLTGLNSPPVGAKIIDSFENNPINYIATKWPSLPILYEIPLYGQSFNQAIETGGKPALSVKNILTIEGQPEEQIYLRNRVYTQKGDYSSSRILRNLEEEKEAFTGPVNSRNFQVNTDYISMIPYAESTNAIIHNDTAYKIQGKDNTIIPDPPIFMNERYTLVEYAEKIPQLTPVSGLEKYKSLNFVPSRELEDLAESLKGSSVELTASLIRNYLIENHVYSLDTEEQKEYTEDFLFNTQEGYCLHFASAFIALARLNDIPCRYVEGFLVIFPTEEEYMDLYDDVPSVVETSITGMASHVWPEIYLGSEKGWVSYEVTAPFVREDSPVAENRVTERQLSQIRGTDELEKRTRTFWENPWLKYLYMIIGLLILTYPVRKLLDLIHHYRKNTSRVIRRYIHVGKRAGIDPPENKGWIKWKEDLTQIVPDSNTILDESIPLILRDRYSPHHLSEKEQLDLKESFYTIKQKLREAKKHKKA